MALAAAASGERRESAVAPAGSVRIATWNVNSVKQRLPRPPGWMSGGRRWSGRRTSSRTTRSSTCRRRARRAPVRRRASRRADLEWRRDSFARGAGRRRGGLPARRVSPIQARAVLVLWRDRVTSVLRTERARPGLGALRASSPGWLRCGTWSPLAPRATIVCGDMNIAPTDDGVIRTPTSARPT